MIPLSRADILEITEGLEQTANSTATRPSTPANRLELFYNALSNSLAHIDLPPEHRERINAFTTAVHNIFETVKEQDGHSEVFQIEQTDLNTIANNLDCFGLVIRIQHSALHHHELSGHLLRAKTALRNLAKKHLAPTAP